MVRLCNFRYRIIYQERLIRSDLLTSILVIFMIHLHAAKLADLSFCSSGGVMESTVPGYTCDQPVTGKALLILRHIHVLWKVIWKLKGPEQYVVFCAAAAISWMVAAFASLHSQRAYQSYMSGVRITLLVSTKFASKVSSIVMLALWPDAPPSSYCKWYLPVEGSVLLWQALAAPVGASRQVYVAAADAACTFCCCWLLSERWPYTSVTPGMLLLTNLTLAFMSLLLAERMEAAEQQGSGSGSGEGAAAAATAGGTVARACSRPSSGAAEGAAGAAQGVCLHGAAAAAAGSRPGTSASGRRVVGSGDDGDLSSGWVGRRSGGLLAERELGSSGSEDSQGLRGSSGGGGGKAVTSGYSPTATNSATIAAAASASANAAYGLGLHGKGFCDCGCGRVLVAAAVPAGVVDKDPGPDCSHREGDNASDGAAAAAAPATPALATSSSSHGRTSLPGSPQQQDPLTPLGGCLATPSSPTSGPPQQRNTPSKGNPHTSDVVDSHAGRVAGCGAGPGGCMGAAVAILGSGHSSAANGGGDGGVGGGACEVLTPASTVTATARSLTATTRSLSHALPSFSTNSNSSGFGVGSGSTLMLAESALALSLNASRPNSLVASEQSRRLVPSTYGRMLVSRPVAGVASSGGVQGTSDGAVAISTAGTGPDFSPFSRQKVVAARVLSADAASAAFPVRDRGVCLPRGASGAPDDNPTLTAERWTVRSMAQSAAKGGGGGSSSRGGNGGERVALAATGCGDHRCAATCACCRVGTCPTTVAGMSLIMGRCSPAVTGGSVAGRHLCRQVPMARGPVTATGLEEEEEMCARFSPPAPELRDQQQGEAEADGAASGGTRDLTTRSPRVSVVATQGPLRQVQRLVKSLLHGGRKGEAAAGTRSLPPSPPPPPALLPPPARNVPDPPTTTPSPGAPCPCSFSCSCNFRCLQESSSQPPPSSAAAVLSPPPAAVPPAAAEGGDPGMTNEPESPRQQNGSDYYAGGGLIRGHPGDRVVAPTGGGVRVDEASGGNGASGSGGGGGCGGGGGGGNISEGSADPSEPLIRPPVGSLPSSGHAVLSTVTHQAAYSQGGTATGTQPLVPIPCFSLSADHVASTGTRPVRQLQTVWQAGISGGGNNGSDNGAFGGDSGGKRAGVAVSAAANAAAAAGVDVAYGVATSMVSHAANGVMEGGVAIAGIADAFAMGGGTVAGLRGAGPAAVTWTPREAIGGGCGSRCGTSNRGPQSAASAAAEDECSVRVYGNFMLARALTASGGHNAVYDRPVLHHTRCSVKVGGLCPADLPPGMVGRLASLMAEGYSTAATAVTSLAAVAMYVREGCVELVADILTPSAAAAAEALMAAMTAAASGGGEEGHESGFPAMATSAAMGSSDGNNTTLSFSRMGAVGGTEPVGRSLSQAPMDDAEVIMTFLGRTLLPQLTSALLPPAACEGADEGDGDAAATFTAGSRSIIGLQASVRGVNLALLAGTGAATEGTAAAIVMPPSPVTITTRMLPRPPSIVCVEPCCAALNQPSEDDTRDGRHQVLTLTVILADASVSVGGDDVAAAALPKVFVRHGGRCLATVVRRAATPPAEAPSGTLALTVQVSLIGVRSGLLFLEAAAAGADAHSATAAAGGPECMLPLSLPWPVLAVGDVRVAAEVQQLQQQLARAAPLRALSAALAAPYGDLNAVSGSGGGSTQQQPYRRFRHPGLGPWPPAALREDQMGRALDGGCLALLLDMGMWFEAVSMPDAAVIAAAAATAVTDTRTATAVTTNATSSTTPAPVTAAAATGYRMESTGQHSGRAAMKDVGVGGDDDSGESDSDGHSSWESSSASGELDCIEANADHGGGSHEDEVEEEDAILTTQHHRDIGSNRSTGTTRHRRSCYRPPIRSSQRNTSARPHIPITAPSAIRLPNTNLPIPASNTPSTFEAESFATSCEAQLALLRALQPPGELLPGSLDCAAEYEALCRRAGSLQSAATGLGLRLLRFSVTRGWVATATLVLRGLMQHCCLSFSHIVALFADAGVVVTAPSLPPESPATGGGGGGGGGAGLQNPVPSCVVPLLHTAVLSGRLLMVRAVQSWAQRYRCPLAWDEPAAGTGGLTPLHLAAVLEDRGRLAASIMGLWPQAEALWAVARDGSGRTPQEYAVVRSINSSWETGAGSGSSGGGAQVRGPSSNNSIITSAVQRYEVMQHEQRQQQHGRVLQPSHLVTVEMPSSSSSIMAGVAAPAVGGAAVMSSSNMGSPLARMSMLNSPFEATAAITPAAATAAQAQQSDPALAASARSSRVPSILPLTPAADVATPVGVSGLGIGGGGAAAPKAYQTEEHRRRLLQQVLQHLVAQRLLPSSVDWEDSLVALHTGCAWPRAVEWAPIGGVERSSVLRPLGVGVVSAVHRVGGYGSRFDRPSDCGSASFGHDSQWSHSTNFTAHTYSTLQQAATPQELRPASPPTRHEADMLNLKLLSMANLPDMREDASTHPPTHPSTTNTAATAVTTASAAPVGLIVAATTPEGSPSLTRCNIPRSQGPAPTQLPVQSSPPVASSGPPTGLFDRHRRLGHHLAADPTAASGGGVRGAGSSSNNTIIAGGIITAGAVILGSQTTLQQQQHQLPGPWASGASMGINILWANSAASANSSSHAGPSRLACCQQQQRPSAHLVASAPVTAPRANNNSTSGVGEDPLVAGAGSAQAAAAAGTDYRGRQLVARGAKTGSGLELAEEAQAARTRCGAAVASCDFIPASAASVAIPASELLLHGGAERQGLLGRSTVLSAASRMMTSGGVRLLAGTVIRAAAASVAADGPGAAFRDTSYRSHDPESVYSSYGSQRSAVSPETTMGVGAEASGMGGRGIVGFGCQDSRRPFTPGTRRGGYADEYAPVCVPSVSSRTAALDAALKSLPPEVLAAAVGATTTVATTARAHAVSGPVVATSCTTAPVGPAAEAATPSVGASACHPQGGPIMDVLDRVAWTPSRSADSSKVVQDCRPPACQLQLGSGGGGWVCAMPTSRDVGSPSHHYHRRHLGSRHNLTSPHNQLPGLPSEDGAARRMSPARQASHGATVTAPLASSSGYAASPKASAPVVVASRQTDAVSCPFVPTCSHDRRRRIMGSQQRLLLLLSVVVLWVAVVLPMVL